MNINEEIMKKTEYLFKRDYISELNGTIDLTEEEEQKYDQTVEELYKKYNWDDIFNCWVSYLYDNCKNPIELYNFANLFWAYGGYEKFIPDPYKFLAYFYYKADPNDYEEVANASTIMDILAIEILHRAGISGVTNSENPYYNPQEDPKMIKEIEKWKKQDK